ncbi:hypothetical protein JVU11DRAFT_7244 [Chiua virens]|nr:hypothetical protein JVU11DRAFT_7244 [Chiua virens]
MSPLEKHTHSGPSAPTGWKNGASAHSSISFWDLTTRTKIGSNIDHDDLVWTIAISENYDIAIGHGKKITIRNLGDILPPNYVRNNVDPGQRMTSLRTQADEEMTDHKAAVREVKDQLALLQNHHEAQSRELASAQKDLETLKSSNKAKDLQIDALTVDVDHWKRSDAAKTEELVVVCEGLQFFQPQSIQIQEWYDKHLKSVVEQSRPTLFPVQNFIIEADGCVDLQLQAREQQKLLACVQPVLSPGMMPNNMSSSSGDARTPSRAANVTTMNGPHMATDLNQSMGTDMVVIEPTPSAVNVSSPNAGRRVSNGIHRKPIRRPTVRHVPVYGDGNDDRFVNDELEMGTIRVKLYYQGDVRGMMMSPLTSFDEFVERVTTKFGTSLTELGMKFMDEEGTKITLRDQDDFELAIETARENGNGKSEGKIEVWCADAL